MAAELHPSLGAAPPAKPVCCGCATTDGVLVPVSLRNATTFMCASCAVMVWSAAVGEHLRRVAEMTVDLFAPPVPGRLQ